MSGSISTGAGDDLDRFMSEHYSGVVRTVAVACGDVVLAHDAVHEALARAMEQRRRGRSIDHLPGWIVVVALNQLRSSFRRRTRESSALAKLPTSNDLDRPGLDDASLIDLQRALVLLPMRQRQCIVLHHLQDYGVDELSWLLGVSSGTVKSALFRGEAPGSALQASRWDFGASSRWPPHRRSTSPVACSVWAPWAAGRWVVSWTMQALMYDPATDEWSPLPDLPGCRVKCQPQVAGIGTTAVVRMCGFVAVLADGSPSWAISSPFAGQIDVGLHIDGPDTDSQRIIVGGSTTVGDPAGQLLTPIVMGFVTLDPAAAPTGFSANPLSDQISTHLSAGDCALTVDSASIAQQTMADAMTAAQAALQQRHTDGEFVPQVALTWDVSDAVVTIDVFGFADDSVSGVAYTVEGRSTPQGWVVGSATAASICRRGVAAGTDGQLCI